MKTKDMLFNKISSIYGLFFNIQVRNFTTIFTNIKDELDLSNYKNIIDIGCGTGALCNVLHEKGLSVTGIDPAKRMIEIAKKKSKNKEIEFIESNVLTGLPFGDKSFDVSISSFVAHGLNKNERQIMYDEMKRITKHLVVIYDYNEHRGLITDIAEWLEGGDYFNFIKTIKQELNEKFSNVKIVKANIRSNLYVAKLCDI
ncbi:class I SAM-dependent methyltransferase [Sedimentibacter hydroxybenzoicus DSM 7310]|uniref:Class I SAM-dependent methyltransferase n=1 Tax=Sedimentibacter hydroxybenzoicus DSM 7310 TaxID=1123245 RepID=A0A974BIY2_SEDHY|nr:class I SAM-dependent methyltransferase [Sedimentibacter hydroxybenzoicus]NYB74100.1 class I SAM-dependent methyltransferase [Sedimentibacter hydroxybenzoicus DSM 7310]